MLRQRLVGAATRSSSLLPRGAVALQVQRGYQGNLQDKDRIFTNVYNDGSQFLEGAKKRVRCAQPAERAPERPRAQLVPLARVSGRLVPNQGHCAAGA